MAIIEFGTDRMDVGLEADLEAPGSVEEQGVEGQGPQPEPVPERFLGRLTGPLSEGWGARLTLAWLAIYAIGLVVEPAPANPNATPGVVEVLLGWGFLAAWSVMAVGFSKRKRYGAVTSLLAGGVLVALTIACPVSGHHNFGAWWLFEAAGSATLVALSARALKES